MNRVDGLKENDLVQRIATVRTQFDALKTSQRAGSTSVIVSRLVTGNNVDFSFTSALNVVQMFEATLTYDNAPFSNSNFLWQAFWDVITLSGTGDIVAYTEVLPPEAGQRHCRLWIMGTTSATATYGMRVVIYAIGKGSFTVAQII